MHRHLPTLAAVLAASLLLNGSTVRATSGDTPEVVDKARSLLEKGETGAAVECLEGALSVTPPDRHAALFDLLRRAYEAAAKEAEARGRTSEAELYRDNLEILNRRHPAPPEMAPSPAPSHATATPSDGDAALPPEVIAPTVPAPSGPPDHEIPKPGPESTAPGSLVPARPAGTVPDPVPAPGPAPAPAPAVVDVATADAAFSAKHYEEAGRLYAALDREGRLPAARRDHWAYCRWVEVVRRINAGPSPEEWVEIDAEIQRIRALSPNNWYGEYLRNRAAERTVGARTGKGKSKRLLVRGSAPEEAPPRVSPDPGKSAAPRSSKAPGPGTVTAPGAAPTSPRTTAGEDQWQVRETPSFRILHHDPELAEKAAEVAEEGRDVQIRRWAGAAPKGPWTPKCDIYLYPSARVFSRMTGQPEQSPGFSTMGMNGGRIVARRVNLRADHPNLLKAVMPHEITHVVLADLFPHQQIPRWADEGMAVLSEPHSEQYLRAADLDEPLAKGQLFKLADLMAMDYPDGKFWGLYYAQSVSLTRFLVEQGTPTQFIQFVQRAQRNGVEAELKRVYHINSLADLQNRWISYAQSKTNEVTATSADPDRRTSTTRR